MTFRFSFKITSYIRNIYIKSLETFWNLLSKPYYSFICALSWMTSSWLTWNKFSEGMLRALEKKILQCLRTPYKGCYVDIGPVVGPADKIWTIQLNSNSSSTPLVLLHGLGAGVGLWCLNLDYLAATRPVYAFDLLGFGRSSRPDFSKNSWEAEQQMVRAIEEWRKEMKLNKFILLGHSMGGFLAASYSMSYPERVKYLILADPWGFPKRPEEFKDVPFLIKTISYVMQPFNPLTGIRVAGPFGPWFINKLRPDISKKYATALNNQELIPQYIYQCNSQYPSGESGFHCMMSGFGWAKNPLVKRIHKLDRNLPVTLLYGSRSWIDHSAGSALEENRAGTFFELQVISGAGHHVYADKPEIFNQVVVEACKRSDNINRLAILPSSDKPESDFDIDRNRHLQ